MDRPRHPILVVSAFAPELAPLATALRTSARRNAAVAALPVGIGLVDAGIGTALAIARFAPRVIVFVGTAGCYNGTPAIGDVVIARRATLASGGVARGDSYFPAPMSLWTTSSPGVRRSLLRAAPPGSQAVDVATPLAITQTAALASRLSNATNAAVENLEVFAVARAAHEAGVPFGAVLGVSNRVGPSAHLQWRRHQAAATLAACAVVEGYLTAELTEPSRSSYPAPHPGRPRRSR